jgi:para-nitrobenzyl esterase
LVWASSFSYLFFFQRLDLYTPAGLSSSGKEEEELLPVLVYVHGGGFETGGVSMYPRQDLANLYAGHGVVFHVHVEYRLGFIGFARNGRAGLEGNWGLRDQIQALRWWAFDFVFNFEILF